MDWKNIGNMAAGGIFGIALGHYNDERQYEQQQRLQELQIKGQKEMMDYGYDKQLAMWDATNYKAQMEHLRKAGLNPAMLYGMKGGGGITTGTPTGSVQGAGAPTGGREIQDSIGMGIQFELLEAQKRVLETQADKNAAEATKTAGVDTQEATTRIASLTQGIQNQKAQEEMTKAETALKTLQLEIGKHTQEDQEDFIYYQTKQAMYHVGEAERQAFISRATMNAKVDIVRAEAVQAALQNELTRHQIKLTDQQTTAIQKQIGLWVEENMREWDKMSQENQRIATQKLIADYNTDPVNKVAENVSRMIDNIFIITKQGLSEVKRNPIGFKQ